MNPIDLIPVCPTPWDSDLITALATAAAVVVAIAATVVSIVTLRVTERILKEHGERFKEHSKAQDSIAATLEQLKIVSEHQLALSNELAQRGAQELKYKQARDLIVAIADVRTSVHEARTAAQLLDAKADLLSGARGEDARVFRTAPDEYNHCVELLVKLRSLTSTAKQCLVQARNAGLFGDEPDGTVVRVHSNLDAYLRSVEGACIMEEPSHYIGSSTEHRAKRELRWEQISGSLKETEQQDPQAMLNAMTLQQDKILRKLVAEMLPADHASRKK
jgi:hypothetical protein